MTGFDSAVPNTVSNLQSQFTTPEAHCKIAYITTQESKITITVFFIRLIIEVNCPNNNVGVVVVVGFDVLWLFAFPLLSMLLCCYDMI